MVSSPKISKNTSIQVLWRFGDGCLSSHLIFTCDTLFDWACSVDVFCCVSPIMKIPLAHKGLLVSPRSLQTNLTFWHTFTEQQHAAAAWTSGLARLQFTAARVMWLPSNYPPQPLSRMLMVFTGEGERTSVAGAAAGCYAETHGVIVGV